MKINIPSIVLGASTYPNRSGRSYKLNVRSVDPSHVDVFYEITSGAARRLVSRRFPKQIEINSRFLWVLGLLRGEGLRSKGAKSSIYRFNIVNNDLEVIQAVIRILDESGLAVFDEYRLRPGLIRISYGPYCDTWKARRHWARGLGIPLAKVEISKRPEPQKRARFGSCMFTLNDVLLRRVMDLIAQRVHFILFR